jgi:hypothetical protein
MVHSEIEASIATVESEEEEEGQYSFGRNSLAILARRLRESCR